MGDKDEFEELFARGITDGLPVVPPTRELVGGGLDGPLRVLPQDRLRRQSRRPNSPALTRRGSRGSP